MGSLAATQLQHTTAISRAHIVSSNCVTCRPRCYRVVAAAASTEASTERLTKDDLVAYIAKGCKPRSEWR